MDNKKNSNDKIVQDVCGVSDDRSKELLEAASGNVERAIEIHLFSSSSSSSSLLLASNQQQHTSPHSHRQEALSSTVILDTEEVNDKTIAIDAEDETKGKASKHEIAEHSSSSNVAVAQKRPIQRQSPSTKKQAKLSSFFLSHQERKELPSSQLSSKSSTSTLGREKMSSHETPAFETRRGNDEGKTFTASLKQTKSPPTEALSRKSNVVYKKNANEADLPSSLHYLVLAEAFSDMAATTKRLAKIEALKQVLKGVIEALGGVGSIAEDSKAQSSPSKPEILYHTLALILPNEKLQVSGSSVSKAVMDVTGASRTKLREAYRRTGDLGDAAGDFVRNQSLLVQPKPLTIPAVYSKLQTIASQTGKGSQTKRQALMVQLLRSCRQSEMRFLVRTLLSNMRLGASLKTVLVALACSVEELDATRTNREACIVDATEILQQTFNICPRLDRMCSALLAGGISHMQNTCVLEVGIPVNPMLANPASSLHDVAELMTAVNHSAKRDSGDVNAIDGGKALSSIASMGLVAVAEWKYDGQRCQAHFDGDVVKLYSRHLLENTDQFPDVVTSLLHARTTNVQSFIVDAEIVAVERLEGDSTKIRLLPFQDLATRSTSGDGGDSAIIQETQVEVRIYAFDLILVNGTSLLGEPLWKRQQLLRQNFRESSSFAFAASLTLQSYNEKAISEFLQNAVQGGAEGLMVKLSGEKATPTNKHTKELQTIDPYMPKCSYESGSRSQTWLKLKRDYVAGFADTIDVVPIGAWYGNGRKAQKGFLSPVLLAVYDDEEDVFRSVSRCMSFSDKMYTAMRNFYFDGIPYPAGVGKDDAIREVPWKEGKSDLEDEVITTGNDIESSSNDDESHEYEENKERINCFRSRPSSAVIVTNESPPIWFKPKEVFEVSFADLSLSRQHTAAAGIVDADSSRGVALRFPRFCRRRPDKKIQQATTTTQIAYMFAKQAKQGRLTNKPAKK